MNEANRFDHERFADERWRMAKRAAMLIAIDPNGLRGAIVRGPPSPAREKWSAYFSVLHDAIGLYLTRVPSNVGEEALNGSIDLAATLASGRIVDEPGLLARARNGVMLVSGAERLSRRAAALIASELDRGPLSVIAFEESEPGDDGTPKPVVERLAFRIDLDGLPLGVLGTSVVDVNHLEQARRSLPNVACPDYALSAVCEAAARFGAGSVRSDMLTLRAARAIAALDGKAIVDDDALAEAAALVLAPRAEMLPMDETQDDGASDDNDGREGEREQSDVDDVQSRPDDREGEETSRAQQILVDAIAGALPPEFAALKAQRPALAGSSSAAGQARRALDRGRVVGVRPGRPRGGARLDLLATLTAAAPWQRLRRNARPGSDWSEEVFDRQSRIVIRPSDLRIRRYQQKASTLTIFVVDASGSAALNRLAEGKGAVELLLADCYVRRDKVALVAFRGTGSELLLPPTRSLTRAKRALRVLPGGGGTPLASALLDAQALACSARNQGDDVTLVILTDGRANVGFNGQPGRREAEANALSAARTIRAAGLSAILVDMSPRPYQAARAIAAAMDGVYAPLPNADAAALSTLARQQRGRGDGRGSRRSAG